MLREAELFVMAEQMLVEVLGRVREQDRQIVLPPMYPGAMDPLPIEQAIGRHLRQDVLLPGLVGDRVASPAPGAGVTVAQAAEAACAAARRVVDGAAAVDGAAVAPGQAPLSTRAFLLRATLERSLLAHYVAAYLGSTACPLAEELARPLWELTAPDAPAWRASGYFRAAMPLPDHVSWRDRFLLDGGHEPHPLGH